MQKHTQRDPSVGSIPKFPQQQGWSRPKGILPGSLTWLTGSQIPKPLPLPYSICISRILTQAL